MLIISLDTTRPATRSNTASKLNEFRTEHSDRDIYEITSSQTEPAEPNSQSSNGESRSPLSSHDKKTMDLMSDMAALAGIKDIEAYRREIQSGDSGEDKCRLCLCPLPDGYLEPWKDQSIDGIIRLEMWTKICQSHTRETLEDEWRKKGYPKPDWRTLASRITKHLRVLKKIIADKVNSRFRDQFAQQQKEIKGNTAMLLRQERKLTFPGYYGPRGGDIL